MPEGGKLPQKIGFFAGIFSLFLALNAANLPAKTQQWDFQLEEDYRFDSQQLEWQQGTVSLKKREPFQDKDSKDFAQGQFDENVWAAQGSLELIPQTAREKVGPSLPLPISSRTSGLIALWHLDEPSGTNTLDEVARNVAKASDTQIVSGQTGLGYARSFDGIKGHVFIPHYKPFVFDSPFTLEAWIRPQVTLNDKSQTIVSRWQTVAGQKSFAFQIATDGRLDFQVSPDGATTQHHFGDTVLTPGVWYHVAAVYTGSDLCIYLNGALDATPTSFRGPVYSSSNPIYIGALVNNRVDEFFEGVIDEVAFYNRALTELETFTHFGNREGMIALWHLNERAGILTDRSGYGHNLTAQNKPDYEVPGKFELGLRFNGKDQFLLSPPSFRLAPNDELTLEAWINPEKVPGQNQKATILSLQSETEQFSFYVDGPAGNLAISAPMLSPEQLKGQSQIMPGVWQHVAVSIGKERAVFYINGVKDKELPFHGLLKMGKSAALLGMDPLKVAPFQGVLDEVSIYRRFKTETEIGMSAGTLSRYGVYTSSAKDAGSALPWQVLSWNEAKPYGKPIDTDFVGLVHYYPLNEVDEAALVDAKSDIPLNGSGTYAVPGIFGNARWFQNGGRDKIISSQPMPPLSTFTVSTWFQFSNREAGLSDRLFSIGDENPTIYRSAPDGKLHVVTMGARKISSRTSYQDTQWHHLALTSDGNHLFLYIDGLLEGNTPFVSPTGADPLILGNLKTTDTFQGALDEFAFFNHALSRDEIQDQIQSARIDSKFLVRVSDDPTFSNVPWKGPAGSSHVAKEAGAATVGQWPFNERILKGQPGEITDQSRFANHGTLYGNVQSTSDGAIANGFVFNGAGDYIEIPDSESLRPKDQMTLSAWIKPFDVSTGSRILDKRYQQGSPTFSSYSLELAGGNRLALRLGYAGGYQTITTDRDGEIATGQWNHVAATFDGKTVRLYINGQLRKTGVFDNRVVYDEGALYVGKYGSGQSGFFAGGIDEVSMDQEALSAEVIMTLYQKADPKNFFTQPVNESLKLDTARYFQYQTHLSTQDPVVGPLISSVEVRGSDYTGEKPYLINNVSVSYAEINKFVEKTGPNHRGEIRYQISNDGLNWFFHNGRHWVIAANAQESNTADQINEHVLSITKEIGIGSFYFKAFLYSPTGIEPVELQAVEIEYLPNKLTLTSPNGTEDWLVESDQTIRWNSTGDVNRVQLEYSKDGFVKDFHIIAKDLPNTGTYNWKVPVDVSPNVKIRVLDALDPRIHDTSDISFRMTGAFEVIQPNWNERWVVGSEQEIKWRTLGNILEVRLEYSTDEFKSAIYPIVDSVKNDGKWIWKVPDLISSNIKVRVSDLRDPLVFDQSNDTFAIIGNLKVLKPDPQARLLVGSSQEIKWETVGSIPAVKIEYTSEPENKEAEWKTVEAEVMNRGFYLWAVPDNIGNEFVLRVSDPRDKKVFALTEPFAIIGGLRLINPKGGEYWTVSSRRKIAWQTVGTIPTINLMYATADPSQAQAIKENPDAVLTQLAWQKIQSNVANIGSFVWEIPDTISPYTFVRISDERDPFVAASNPKAVHLIPGFELSSPNGGESLKIGDEANVTWATNGTISQIKLEYSKDNFKKDIHEIIGKGSNIGRFSWKIPDDPATNLRLRISDPKEPRAHDISDTDFRIYGGFDVKAPVGGVALEVGSLAVLEWETKGSIAKVRLEYSHDDFNKDIRTIIEAIDNQGRFTWTVPDDIASGLNIRVTDVDDPKTFAISEGHFSIVGTFHLTYPTGAENITADSLVRIVWKGAGTVPFVRIDYSEDEFTKSFSTIADAASNNGTYEWTVPNRVGHHFKLRIWDPSHPESMYVMPQAARIIAGFKLEAPNGGEVLYVGEPFEVSWNTYGTITRVKLEASSDNFQKDIIEIADNYENLGRYKWQVPDLISGLYRIRISDPKDITAYDISNADFRIRTRFTLTGPTGSEGWPVGEIRTIRWLTSGNVKEVLLEYSTDDFKSVTTIAEAAPNTGTFDWAIPNHVSQNVKVRVSDIQDPGSFDVSANTFRIEGHLELLAPSANEILKVGQVYPLNWKTIGDIQGVRLEYSRDGFASEAVPIAESMVNSGNYSWTVPDALSDQVKIRIVDLKDANVYDISKSPFQIAASFLMMAPNGGEVWHAREQREINWVTIGTVPEINLAFCYVESDEKGLYGDCEEKKSFSVEQNLMNTGRHVWDIPRILGENVKVQVCDSQFPKICDSSDRLFSMRSPLEMNYPRGGELWPVGSEQEIRWHTFGSVEKVLVQYAAVDEQSAKQKAYDKFQWKNLGEGIDNQNHFLLKVPDDISKFIFFRVADWNDETLYAASKEPIQIVGTFALLSPNGGEKWAAGSVQQISWDTVGTTPNVRLEYSIDDFKNDIKLIEASFTNIGHYDWTVPADQAVTAKVRVADASNPVILDSSDNPFKIMAGFEILSPNGGEKWKVGSKQKINWKTEDRADRVRIEYRPLSVKMDGQEVAAPWQLIVEDLPNGGEYEWTVPNSVGKQMFVRVMDLRDADAFDDSNEVFEIQPDVVVTQPNGNENWLVGQSAEIRWVSIGNLGKVKIEYSKDNFAADTQLIAADLVDTGSYLWTPIDDITENAKIRITSLDNGEVLDVSDQPFRILPFIQVLSPAGNEKWTVGSTEKIRWDWHGKLDSVRLEFSQNDFVSSAIIADGVPNTGQYDWTIPDIIHANVKIKVSDANHLQSFGVSSEPFKVMPGFKVITPNGGDLWSVGERHKIEWQTLGSSARVKLEYATFASEGAEIVWKPISNVLRNTGEYEWQIPEDVSSQVKVRVLDVLDVEANDVSDGYFKILGVFNPTAPKSAENLIVDSAYEIKWETLGQIPSVKLEFLASENQPDRTAQFETIEKLWNNSGNYFWTVPDRISEKVWLKLSDANEPDAFWISPEPFHIRGKLTFDLPVGKASWPIGSLQSLKWNTIGGIPHVDLFYSTDQGKEWKVIQKSIPNAGQYGWSIPDDAAFNVKLRIEDSRNAEVADESTQPLVIAVQFVLSQPESDTRWRVGDTNVIRWQTTGHTDKIILDYLLEETWAPIAGPMADTGSFEWLIPDTITQHTKLRVRDGNNEEAFMTSEPFQVVGDFELIKPVGGEIWKVGHKESLEWKTIGSVPLINIEAIVGEENPESLILMQALPNTGKWDWIVTDKISNHVRIRISDVRDSATQRNSPDYLAIVGNFDLASPKGTEIWKVGSEQELVWTSQGTIPSVLLEYSRDDFYRDINTIASDVPNTGAALWTVPDAISDTVKVRVSDFRDPRASAISAQNFAIKGVIQLESPKQSDIWTVNDSKQIAWQTTGTIPNVRIEYSTDHFQQDIQVIENSVENVGRYNWKIPDAISNQMKVRVMDANDSAVVAISDPFKVQGALLMLSFGQDETLTVLSQQPIRWEAVGTFPKVRLEYSRDGFVQDKKIIAQHVSNNGFYSWTVPNDIGEGVKIRVINENDFNVYAESAGTLNLQGAFAFMEKQERERWAVGTEKEIRWETIGTIPWVRLEYTRDDFQQDIQLIADQVRNQGKYIWVIPDTISDRVKIRITDTRTPKVFSVTSSPLSIVGTLQLTEPKEDALLKVATDAPIQWNTTGTLPAVRLEYAAQDASFQPDQPISWKLITGSAENTGHFMWQVPDAISNYVKVRVAYVHDPEVDSISVNEFAIVGQLNLIGPQGGQRWIVGTKHDLLWETIGTIPEVRLEYSRDDFRKDIQTIEEIILNTGRYLWIVPDTISDQVKIRISDARDPRVQASSQSSFSMIGDFIFSHPVEPVEWVVGSEQLISWQTVGTVPRVRLELIGTDTETGAATQAPVMIIQDGLENRGEYQWRIPDRIGKDYHLRIANSRDSSVIATAPTPIKIMGALKMVTPRAGDILTVGQEQLIEWQTTGTIPEVALEYSRDGFQRDINVIQSIAPNNNRFLWTVPDSIHDMIQVRVRDIRDEKVFAISDAFTILGALQIMQPARSADLKVGTPFEVVWKNTGSIPQVRLEYSLDGFKEDIRLIEKAYTPASGEFGSYSWNVPDAIGDKMTLRVTDARNDLVSSTSEFFAIHGQLQLKAPLGGETWTVSDHGWIRWDTIGSVPYVQLEYSRDGFVQDRHLIEERIENKGAYAWTIEDAISPEIWIRVSDAFDQKVYSMSPGPLRIRGALHLTAPRGHENWQVGSVQQLEWQTIGTIPKIQIQYLGWEGRGPADPASEQPLILESELMNQGTYQWTVPDKLSPFGRIRILDIANPDVFDEIYEPIKLLGKLHWVTPNTPQKWEVGSRRKLVWQTSGFVPNIKLEYSRDNFDKEIGVIYPLLANNGEVEWVVPDIIGANVKIRVADAENPVVNAVTSVPIEVTGTFKILMPAEEDALFVGTTVPLSWQTTGTVPQVNLEYSFDGFRSHHEVVAEKIPNSGQFSWQVPDAINSNVTLRVSDASNPNVAIISPIPFAIKGELHLTSPRGTEILKVGDAAEITWATVGSIRHVILEYSKDDFMSAKLIAGPLPNQGKFAWQVPDDISEDVRIRLSSAEDPLVFSWTNAVLKIQGSFEFVSPIITEYWISGSQHNIIWRTAGSIPHVNLEYSEDNFATAVPIVLGAANSGNYTWTLPDIRSDVVKLRISNTADQSVFAISNQPIQVGGELALITPAGGEAFKVDEKAEVKWQTTGTIPKVKLEVSPDNFTQDIRVIEDSAENTGSYFWKVPDWIKSHWRIRLSDAAHPEIHSTSPAPFKITGDFAFTAPQGGESWEVGSKQKIRWKTRGSVPVVRLEYSKDGFVTSVPIALKMKNSDEYEWQVPDLVGNEILFKIADVEDPTVSSMMQYAVAIKGVFSITAPHGGEVWTVASQHPITWHTTGSIPNVNIEYLSEFDKEPIAIAENVPNTGSFIWAVPDIKAQQIRIRIADSMNPRVYAESPAPLHVQGKIHLLKPTGGEIWLVGSDQPISWESFGNIENVRIEYSTDHFRTVNPVVMSAPNTGSFLWKVPDALSQEVRVRVLDVENTSVQSSNEKVFEIRGSLILISPTGGEIWAVGSRQALSWQSFGSIPQVRLEYSADDFATDVNVITPALANQGLYHWEIPAITSDRIKIRVIDSSNPYVYDTSRGDVRLAGELRMLFPNAGEILHVGEKINIRWRSSSNIKNVKLEYSSNDFQTVQTISTYYPNSGDFAWNVPDEIGDNLRIKVSDVQNSLVFAFSEVPFSIRGSFNVLAPKGGEVWPVGSKQTIRWETLGSIGRVTLEYSGDDFATAVPIATHIENTGSYVWNVPEVLFRKIRLRVSDSKAPSIRAESAGSVDLVGGLRLISPQGGERWITNEDRIIRWESTGYIPQVTLEYSKDNFEKDVHLIAQSVPNVGSYIWRVPNDRSNLLRLRIKSATDAGLGITQDQPFKIDYYQIRWMIRDARTQDHLSGLTVSDSTGKTVDSLSSPVTLEYPYGIYTTNWTKPGYAPHQSSWLADKDQTFTVELDPSSDIVEGPRLNFEYNASNDLVNITAWYARNGEVIPAVVHAEVNIYEGSKLIKTLTSNNPDSQGYFRMIWDTTAVTGDKRYLASASIHSANGQLIASPISYQIDIPVKEKKERIVKHPIRSSFLKPLGAVLPGEKKEELKTPAKLDEASAITEAVQSHEAPEPVFAETSDYDFLSMQPTPTVEQVPMQKKVIAPQVHVRLIVPESAVINEMVSIIFMGPYDAKPVIDIYDASHKLIISGQAMQKEMEEGKFSYLLHVKGIGFIPGSSVSVTVIDRNSQNFYSGTMKIETASQALGYEREIGVTSALKLASQLTQLRNDLKDAVAKNAKITPVLDSIDETISELAVLLTEDSLDHALLSELNAVAQELAKVAEKKGFDASYLVAMPLEKTSNLPAVNSKVRDIQSALAMLRRLYYLSSASA